MSEPQQAAVTDSAARITPLCVFAAGRYAFDVLVRQPSAILQNNKLAIFEALPLSANGWKFEQTECIEKGFCDSGAIFALWRKMTRQ